MGSNLGKPHKTRITLSPQEERFVSAYLRTGQLLKSVKEADLGEGQPDGALYAIARRMRERPIVAAEIAARLRAHAMPSEEVLMRLADIARATPEDFLDIAEDGSISVNLLKAQELEQMGVIQSIEGTKYGLRVRLYDKLKALELLGKYHALWVNVIRREEWREIAVRDIRNGNLTYEDLMKAFQDPDVVRDLFNDANIPLPAEDTITIDPSIND